jgi:hypothetical protein
MGGSLILRAMQGVSIKSISAGDGKTYPKKGGECYVCFSSTMSDVYVHE